MLALLATAALGSVPLPAEVRACIDRGVMWVADAQSVDEVRLPRDDGRMHRALQIVDRYQGWTGHLLLFPEDCRLTVLAVGPLEGAVVRTARLYPGPHAPTDAETRALLEWAGHAEPGGDDPELAAAGWLDPGWQDHGIVRHGALAFAHSVRPTPPSALPGLPPPQRAAWTAIGAVDGIATWRIDAFDVFSFAVPTGRDGAILYPAAGPLPALGLAVYDAERDVFAWSGEVPVAGLTPTAIVTHGGLVWMVGPPPDWTLFAFDGWTGDLHALQPVDEEGAPATLGPDGLILASGALWTWDLLEALAGLR